jgi:hypothetical protein
MTYKCGHPKTPENSWSAGRSGYRRCKQCRQVRRSGGTLPRVFIGDGVTTFRACGHPLTPENSWSRGKPYPRCKICQKRCIDRWRENGHTDRRGAPQPTASAPRRTVIDLSHDPVVQLYRAEKARRFA